VLVPHSGSGLLLEHLLSRCGGSLLSVPLVLRWPPPVLAVVSAVGPVVVVVGYSTACWGAL